MLSSKKYLLEDDSSDQEEKLLVHNGQAMCTNPNNQKLIFAGVSNINIKEQQLTQLWFISITYFIFAVVELVAGYYANSIAIMSDAAHSFSDCFCFLIYN